MKFVEVKEPLALGLKGRKKNRNNLTDGWLVEFMEMSVKTVRIEFEPGEYVNSSSCITTFYNAVHRLGLPIHVFMHNGEAYLERTDM